MNEIALESVNIGVDLNKKFHVLHVDDDVGFLVVAKQCIEMEAPVQIESANSVEEAIKKLDTEKFDVIVSDYQMPNKDGLEFLRELREKGNLTPFIIFTGKGREEVVIKALNLGADQYLNKTGDPETVYCELAHAISEVARRREAEEALNRTQKLLSSIVNSTNDMIWSVSADDFRLLTFNKAMTDYFLRTQGLVLKAGLNTKEIMPTEQLAQKWFELNRRALKEESFSIEYKTLKDPRVLEITLNVLKHEGKPYAIAVFAKDITELKKVEEALAISEEQRQKSTHELVQT